MVGKVVDYCLHFSFSLQNFVKLEKRWFVVDSLGYALLDLVTAERDAL